MYHLVALIFLVVNGQVSPNPIARLGNHTQFSDEAACMNYFDTTAGGAAKAALEKFVHEQDEALTVQYKCVKDEDGSI